MSGKEIGSLVPDRLGPVGAFPVVTKLATIKAGAGALVRGQVLGKITKGAVTSSFSGTGNGTLTLDATEPRLSGSKAGTYKVVFTGATTYKVIDPDGNIIGIESALGSFANKLKFSIAAGATAFVAGDVFSLVVASGSGYLAAFSSEAVDGTEQLYALLLEGVENSTDVQYAPVALTGEYVADALVFANEDDSYKLFEDELRAIGIYGKNADGGD
jgi:hypothetical protein